MTMVQCNNRVAAVCDDDEASYGCVYVCSRSSTGLKMRSCEQLEIFATRTKEIIMMSAIIYASYQQKRSPSYFNMPSSCLVLESGFPVTFSNDKFTHDFSFLQSNTKPGNRYCCPQSLSNKVLLWTLFMKQNLRFGLVWTPML